MHDDQKASGWPEVLAIWEGKTDDAGCGGIAEKPTPGKA